MYKVLFLPDRITIELEQPENLLKICNQANVLIDGTCAGKGICGKCKVQILDGNAGKITDEEKSVLSEKEQEDGYRLACQVMVESDLTVMMPGTHGSSMRKTKMNQLPKDFVLDQPLKKTFVKLKKSSLDEPVSDLDLLRKELKMDELSADARILPVLQEAIAAKRRKFTAVTLNQELLTAEPVDTTDRCYGIAFDIGTTTVVGILWNLLTGDMVDVEGATNPQSIFGSDVISRIQYCIEGAREGVNHTKVMQDKMVACMNEMIAHFCERNEIEANEIYDVTTVGNTTMSHLFLGINPASLAKVPFAPVFSGGVYYRCSDLGLHVNPHAKGYVLPNIAGHVGSDITAVMLATDLFHVPGNTIAIDIGTNGEILAAKDGEVKTCSTAAGPAFEGACIQCGMRAAKGAIEKVVITDDVEISTIENADPIGICGSGLIDVTVQLLNTGLMEPNGNLITREEAETKHMPETLSSRLYGEGTDKGFLLVKNEKGHEIVITQKDMREVQLAKGAILGGILTLMKKLDFTVDEIDQIYIAGAFGNYIDKKNAITMGLLPSVSPDKVISIGNGAGVGASMALLSAEKRRDAEEKVKIIEHVELSQDMDFQEYYIQSMLF